MDLDELMTGTEWVVDARGCMAERLCCRERLQDFFNLVIRELSLKVVGDPHWHQFAAPGGLTGLYLLTESHLAAHTFPEHCLMTLNLYCCRPRREFDWTAAMESYFGATDVRVIRIARGGLPQNLNQAINPSATGLNPVADVSQQDALFASERPPCPALSSSAGERECIAPSLAISREAQG
ncbi:MAG: S-adenosylmethionine decarboxylase family protein [Planctomycetota bacterium]